MTVPACKLVAGEAHLRVRRVLADVLRRIDNKIMAVANKIAFGT